jgi:ATP-dependent Zn protease
MNKKIKIIYDYFLKGLKYIKIFFSIIFYYVIQLVKFLKLLLDCGAENPAERNLANIKLDEFLKDSIYGKIKMIIINKLKSLIRTTRFRLLKNSKTIRIIYAAYYKQITKKSVYKKTSIDKLFDYIWAHPFLAAHYPLIFLIIVIIIILFILFLLL